MQNTQNHHPRKGSKLVDAKLFIVALALAITIGLWNLLSNAAVQADKASATLSAPPPAQADAPAGQDLPPLPTLTSLVPIATLDPQAASSGNVNVSDPPQTTSLRVVGIPTQVIVQKFSPQVNQPVASGGGHSGGGKSSPVTSTGSSH